MKILTREMHIVLEHRVSLRVWLVALREIDSKWYKHTICKHHPYLPRTRVRMSVCVNRGHSLKVRGQGSGSTSQSKLNDPSR